jgi:YidC/Oxa1 family membrane protein insertase
MMKMDADIVVMTMPDLDKYHIKRSIIRNDVEYIYLDHGMASLHMMITEGALDHFDTIFCYGPNHIEEVRQTEEEYGLPHKTLVKTGYGLLDELLVRVEGLEKVDSDKKQILIAPSWQKDNILDSCLDELLAGLIGDKYKVILRPHPEYVKRFPGKMDAIIQRYQDRAGDDFIIETDFSSNETVYKSDLLITDWSTIAPEFSYSTKRPSVFINTPMKIMNPNYTRIKAVPLDISLRDELGKSVDLEKLDTIPEVVAELLADPDAQSLEIAAVVQRNIYDIGDGSRGGAEYLIGRIDYLRELREYRRYQADPNNLESAA